MPDTSNDTRPADQSTTSPTAESSNDPCSSTTASDAPLIPHAASSALSTASNVASFAASTVKSVVDNAASTVKSAASNALEWTEAKVEKLSAKEEDGTGPYGSEGTCAPSDIDPIGQWVLPAKLEPKKDETTVEGQGKK
ncbi:hypothetical protein SLS60_009931 [Paraconiothyrium brasiliense]|uniref:Uncharacterized protein n=1 Tax=Paraconiothyrium brasiliense TaxID=300254 RepID=A0ABR3QTY6_9PLEO